MLSRLSRTAAHTRSQSVITGRSSAQPQARQNPSIERRKWTHRPTLIQEAVCNWLLPGEGKAILLDEVAHSKYSHSKMGPMLRRSSSTQIWLLIFGVCSFFFNLFSFSTRSRTWRWIGREVGKVKEYDRIHCMKFSKTKTIKGPNYYCFLLLRQYIFIWRKLKI